LVKIEKSLNNATQFFLFEEKLIVYFSTISFKKLKTKAEILE
jgi:hypothetical protein